MKDHWYVVVPATRSEVKCLFFENDYKKSLTIPCIIQVGIVLHEVSKHWTLEDPFNVYPSLQMMATNDPYNVPLDISIKALAMYKIPQSESQNIDNNKGNRKLNQLVDELLVI